MEVTEILFTVALRDYPGLPDKERIAAEARYVRALERKLGGHDAAAEALHAVLRLEDAAEDGALSPAALAAVNQWGKAANAARTAGYQGIAELEGSYFDIRTV